MFKIMVDAGSRCNNPPPRQKILPEELTCLWNNPLMVPVGLEEAGQIRTHPIPSQYLETSPPIQ